MRNVIIILYLFGVCNVTPVKGLNSFGGGSCSSSSFLTTSAEPICIRVRTTVQSDIPFIVSSFLSPANSNTCNSNNGGWNNIKYKLDQIFAAKEIEALLKGRNAVLHEGRISHARVMQELAQRNPNNEELTLTQYDVLRLWWSKSHQFRSLLEKASEATGEPNVWRTHNFALTPESEWLRHLQITAVLVDSSVDKKDEIIVGFCEVALLENPVATVTDSSGKMDDANRGCCDDDDDDDIPPFQPAISNLAVAPSFRRRGIAQRLLRTAHRHALQYWGAKRMGLFVQQENAAAMALYEKMGYRPKADVPGNGGSGTMGDMFYMVNEFSPRRRKCEPEKEEGKEEISCLQVRTINGSSSTKTTAELEREAINVEQ